MKVLLINGSPQGLHTPRLRNGVSADCGAQTGIFWIGNKPVSGCTGCAAPKYRKMRYKRRCEPPFGQGARPTHCGRRLCTTPARRAQLPRCLTACFIHQPRGFQPPPAFKLPTGRDRALDQLNKYFTIAGCPWFPQYWNMVQQHARQCAGTLRAADHEDWGGIWPG